MAVRLADIAREAGVSLTTVSRVVNKDVNFSVGRETEEKIWKLVKEMGYSPERKRARGSDKKKKHRELNIGYILTKAKSFSDPYFSQVINGMEQELLYYGHNLAFAYSSYDINDRTTLNKILSMDCDGIIIEGAVPEEQLKLLTDKIACSVVLFSPYPQETFDLVTVDFERYAFMMVERIIGLGHQRIAHIGGIGTRESVNRRNVNSKEDLDRRTRGYLMAMLANSLPIDSDIIANGRWEMEDAYACTKKWLEEGKKFTALFASSDRMAIGAMRAIQEKGLKVPEDISVAGFDDIEISGYISPMLTTISYSKEDIGRYAIDLLLQQIEEAEKGTLVKGKELLIPCRLVERDSLCAPAAANEHISDAADAIIW